MKRCTAAAPPSTIGIPELRYFSPAPCRRVPNHVQVNGQQASPGVGVDPARLLGVDALNAADPVRLR